MFATESALASGAACVGSVRSVRDQLIQRIETSGVNYVEMSLFFGDMSFDEAMFALNAVTGQIIPAVRGGHR